MYRTGWLPVFPAKWHGADFCSWADVLHCQKPFMECWSNNQPCPLLLDCNHQKHLRFGGSWIKSAIDNELLLVNGDMIKPNWLAHVMLMGQGGGCNIVIELLLAPGRYLVTLGCITLLSLSFTENLATSIASYAVSAGAFRIVFTATLNLASSAALFFDMIGT